MRNWTSCGLGSCDLGMVESGRPEFLPRACKRVLPVALAMNAECATEGGAGTYAVQALGFFLGAVPLWEYGC